MGARNSSQTENPQNTEPLPLPKTTDLRKNYFKEDPISLMGRGGTLLENVTFFTYLSRNGISTSFTINGETFAVWTGKKAEDENNQPIKIYNMTLGKLHMTLKGALYDSQDSFFFPYITVLSTYPQYAPSDSKKWLYTGDESGYLRIFDLSDNKFNEINRINLNKGKFMKNDVVLAAMIFDDSYLEIINDPNADKTLVVIYSANDFETGAFIYNLKGESLREIKNEDKGNLTKMNFYYDEINSKTCFFFGWSFVGVKKYDLKSNAYTIKYSFPRTKRVVGINFLFNGTKEKPETFVLYAHEESNVINICSVETEQIIKSIKLFEEEFYKAFIWDFTIWNNKTLIASIYKHYRPPHCHYVVNLETDECKIFENPNNELAETLIKVSLKSENNKEILISCFREGEIYIYK